MKTWILLVKMVASCFGGYVLLAGGMIYPGFLNYHGQSSSVVVGSTGEVALVEVWVTSTDDLPQKFLFPGSPVRYHGMISNQTGETQVVDTNWRVEGPCGVVIDEAHMLITPVGIVDWIFMDTLSLAQCAGNYVLTVTLISSGQTSQATTGFEVVDNRIFLPMARR